MSKSLWGGERDTLIDFGAGNGDFTRMFARQFKKVYCYDISKIVIEIAKKNIKDQNVFYYSDLKMLRSDVDGADCVLMITVLQHIKDDEELVKTLKSIRNCMKKSGKLVLLEDTFTHSTYETEYIKFREIDDFEAIVNNAGFSVENKYGFYHPVSKPTQDYQTYYKKIINRVMLKIWRLGFRKTVQKILVKVRLHEKYITDLDNYIYPPSTDDVSRIYVLST